ncbi:DUF1488 family protein [Paracoccus litorisediminis]|uniref:DUF1488 family protein n=1 Tax=Paracoccus litorisediminis TaxID=2006130 RepID=UPI00373408FD
MQIEIVEGPWKKGDHLAVSFLASIEEEEILCRISFEALRDDYGAPNNSDPLALFEAKKSDILRRTWLLRASNIVLEDGRKVIEIGTGQGMA